MSITFEKGKSIAIEDLTIKQIVYYVKNTKIWYNYWYFVMVICFDLSLDHLLEKSSYVRGTISAMCSIKIINGSAGTI